MKVDFLIVGSGFGGSILAMCLKKLGYEVCMIEAGAHPRFAIGESSTPVADMVLRDLADNYDLPWLKSLSRYGSWQRIYPEILCGKKRGFSYYFHQKNKTFTTDEIHSSELLVAASVDDDMSDTQWYRSDVDSFLVQKAKNAGVHYREQSRITHCNRTDDRLWNVTVNYQDAITSGFILDATGSSEFSCTMFGNEVSDSGFKTNSRAVYSHFQDVPRWHDWLKKNQISTKNYPYDPDFSALHHITEEGWMWMLRFKNDLLSAGFVTDMHTRQDVAEWDKMLSNYPTLQELFSGSRMAAIPGEIKTTGRLQRRLKKMYGEGWAALHHSGGFVDPLHSTGIAHTLIGVEKLLSIFSSKNEPDIIEQLENYEEQFFEELALVDTLVAGCYRSRKNPELFYAFSMLYFLCSVDYEQNRIAGHRPKMFLSTDSTDLRNLVNEAYQKLPEVDKTTDYINWLRNEMAPWNRAGLLDPQKIRMYRHTAVSW